MEITTRSLWTALHGMGFGALFLLAFSAVFLELYRVTHRATVPTPPFATDGFLRGYLLAMTALAWLAVLSGAYIVYPWYRAVAPPGTADLAAYPQLLLKAHANTIGWHSLGMEWKEHVAWFTPVSITMVTVVFFQYGRRLREHPALRSAVLAFAAVSFLSAAVAGAAGAMINKYAPIQGGGVIHLSKGA